MKGSNNNYSKTFCLNKHWCSRLKKLIMQEDKEEEEEADQEKENEEEKTTSWPACQPCSHKVNI